MRTALFMLRIFVKSTMPAVLIYLPMWFALARLEWICPACDDGNQQ